MAIFRFNRLLLVPVMLLGLHSAAGWAQPKPVDRIVAVVNAEVITASELEGRVNLALRQIAQQKLPPPPREDVARQALEQLIMEHIQLQLAKERGLQAEDAAVERAIETILRNNQLDLPGLQKALAADGIAWAEFRDGLRKEIVLTRLREREVDSNLTVSEAEIDNFLSSNPNAFSGQEWLVGHILVRVKEGAERSEVEAARRKLESAVARIRGGEAFAQVAANVSDAPDAMQGGNLGWRSPDKLPALFTEALRTVRPGELSPVIRSPAGFHVLLFADTRGGELAMPAQVPQTRARHILVKVDELTSDNEVRARLEALRERIVHGTDFGEMAKVHSADLSASRGGELGWIYPGDTVPEFERAMNALAPGEVSEPVRSPFGWHLIRVDERRLQDVSDERKRNVARMAVRERKLEEMHQDWLRQVRDGAYVEYRVEER